MILTASRPARTLLTLLLLLPLMLVSFAGAALAEVVGKLTRVEGAVDIMPGGQLPAQPARDGSPVQKGDFVRTKSNARAELTFNDGSVIKIAPRSRIDVGEYSASDRKLGLPRGKVQAIVVPAAAGSAPRSFEIKTPNAIAGVRGTSFYVYHQANITGVAVIQGVVHTASLAQPSRGVTLTAGTATTVTRRNAPTPPRPVSERELNRHSDDVTPAAGQGASDGSGGTGSGEQGGSSAASSSDSTGTAAAGSNGATSGTASSTTDSSSTASTTGDSTLGTIDSLTTQSPVLSSIVTDPVDLDLSPLTEAITPPDQKVLSATSVPPPTFVPPPGTPNSEVTPPPTDQPDEQAPIVQETQDSEHDSTTTTPSTEPPLTEPPPTTQPPTTQPPTTQPPTTEPPTTEPPTTEPPTTEPPPTEPPPTEPPPTEPPPTVPPPTEPPPTEPPPTTQPQFNSLLAATLMSRDSTIDTNSNLLTILSDGSMPLVLSGTESLWTGFAQATLTGAYPTLPLQQPNHYWFGKVFSGDTANHTTADGGAYFGYYQGMSLDVTGETNSHISALYIDPTGKTGIMQVCLSGTIASGAMSSGGTATLTEMTPVSGLNPSTFAANWWDPQNGIIVELTGPVLTQFGTSSESGTPTGTTIPNETSTIPGSTSTSAATTLNSSNAVPRYESEGFMLDSNFNLTSTMSNRGDVLRLAYLSSDPSFGIWSRESFGSYDGNDPMFVLLSDAQWGTLNSDSTFTTKDAIKIMSLGSWQADSGLTGTADGVWGNLDSGSIRLLIGLLTGSSNSVSSTFGAVTTGQFIDLARFVADPTLAAALGFPTLQRPDTFALSGSSAQGSVNIPNITFYSRDPADRVSLWVATNVSGSYSGDFRSQRFSLMNGTSASGSSIIGSMHITSSTTPTGGTWLGSIEGLGETGTEFRSQFDGIVAGSFDGTTFTGSAAGLAHPVTYFNTINGGEVRRFLNGSSALYGNIDGVMGGMSLWNAATGYISDFKGIGFFTPNQTFTDSDFVMSSQIISKDVPSGSATTADGGAYNGHLVGGVNTQQSSPGNPSIQGVMNALAIDPDGNAGIVHGKFNGFIDTETNVWMVDGGVSQAILDLPATGSVTAAGLNSGGVSTVTTPFASGASFFAGSPAPLGFVPDAYTRSFITSSPDWGIGHFGLYAAYSVAPLPGNPWSMDFAIADSANDFRMMGMMNGNPWDPALGTLRAETKAAWHEMQAAQQTATPTTGIFIGETVGTFNPISLQAMTTGIWLETRKFLDLVVNKPGELDKLNIPSVEVGKADFTGTSGGVTVNLTDLRFFAPVTGGRPQVFATDNVNGSYALQPAVGSSVNLVQVPNSGVATSGLAPIFSVNQWDNTNGKWAATISYNGSTGLVAGHGNIQMQGTAAGRTSGGTSGTFTGTAAGIVR